MMHARRWRLSAAESAGALARMLAQQTWTLCSAFCVAGREEYIFLNDATSEDGAGEFAALKLLPEDCVRPVRPVIETPERHGRCRLCA